MKLYQEKEVSQEVIDELLSVASQVLGENAVKMILSGLSCNNTNHGEEIVYKI